MTLRFRMLRGVLFPAGQRGGVERPPITVSQKT